MVSVDVKHHVYLLVSGPILSQTVIINLPRPNSIMLQEDPEIVCGETHGCFRQCISSRICEFRVAWQPQSDGVWFDVMVPPLDDLQDQWLALAFSGDHKMVSELDCVARELGCFSLFVCLSFFPSFLGDFPLSFSLSRFFPFSFSSFSVSFLIALI